MSYTGCPNKHGNSVTIFNLSASAQLGCKINVLRGCVPLSSLNSHVYWDTLYRFIIDN